MSKTFKQGNSKWASKPFAGGTMKDSGCGPTSVADIVANKNENITPWDVAQYITSIGGASNGQGTYWAAIGASLKHYGFTVDWITENAGNQYGKAATTYWNKFIDNLKKDGWGILLMGVSVWTSGGHYIAITDVRKDGTEVYVRDPGARNRTGWYNISTMKNYVKQFWAIKSLKEEPKEEPKEEKKSVDEVAKEVISGKWGEGADRRAKLEAAGYNYNEVQNRVNDMLKSTQNQPAEVYADGYTVGKTYTVQPSSGLNIRKGPGTNYAIASNALKKGAKVECQKVQKVGNDTWIKTKDGWCCAVLGGNIYLQ